MSPSSTVITSFPSPPQHDLRFGPGGLELETEGSRALARPSLGPGYSHSTVGWCCTAAARNALRPKGPLFISARGRRTARRRSLAWPECPQAQRGQRGGVASAVRGGSSMAAPGLRAVRRAAASWRVRGGADHDRGAASTHGEHSTQLGQPALLARRFRQEMHKLRDVRRAKDCVLRKRQRHQAEPLGRCRGGVNLDFESILLEYV
eukprot:CAMPEP_0181228812 /NCGR_PEP_ID=MMETSP1096-20121128/33552_1 /TAXON_ID=156174 ORGANISM="Chrysochromulina ericina, Strain CCMP281" /NCGR_SAMPLE_ID=MMETSP1096 /ASSEMBLY_ACC=CAM_ASM_000453 /LENGTH=205 /DNA_ID=CAMNT_0023322371 /DNA_START=260 /DNA_END=878 /DNA_ORIENTATION=+